MNNKPSLLPSGMYDLLPPEASKESDATDKLLNIFSSFGYKQVSPPLMEFETSLLAERGEELAQQTFRVIDPMSKDMVGVRLGIRPDMTLQVARIASERLADMQRPLRLCYVGSVLQSRAEALRVERQLTQAGVELIGSDAPQADAEVIIIAAESLAALGIDNISIDINLPGLVGELCPEAQDDSKLQKKIKDAITRKDTEMISALPIANSKVIAALVNAAGPVEKALAELKKLKLPQAASLEELSKNITRNFPKLKLTLDPIEYRGFDYHSGISFSIFAKGLRHELGRGGRYRVKGEHATGFTIYITHLLKLLPESKKDKYLLVTPDTDVNTIRDLQSQGWSTLYALSNDMHAEAKKLNCKHIMEKGKIKEI